MTAIATTKKRSQDFERFASREIAATASLEYKQGGIVGFDSSTGLLTNAPSTTVIPCGWVMESVTLGAGGGSVRVKLFYEVLAVWMVNRTAGEAIAAANIGGLAYWLDDQTVGVDDDTNTLPVFGRVWAVDTTAGKVLVEPMRTSNDNPALANLD